MDAMSRPTKTASPLNFDAEQSGPDRAGDGKLRAEVMDEAAALDLDEQPPEGPEDGFGRLWRKEHWIRLTGAGVSPSALVSEWKAHFGEFWPGENRFFGAITGLQPGELAVISLEMPGDTTL